jgi:uncharacterized membrane protein HdeD (DUF308 family)
MNAHDSPDINPYAPSSEYIEPIRERRSMAQWMHYLLWFQAGCSAVALPVMLIQIERIIPMGIFFSLLGVFLAVAAYRNKQPRATWIGVCSICFCVAILLIINLGRWSPDDARVPVPILSAIFVAWLWIYTWLTLKSDRSKAPENDADLGKPSPDEAT